MKAGLITMPTLVRTRVVDKMATRDGELAITTLGHAALMFQYRGKVIHVDPVIDFTGDLAGQPKADLILITHEHADHLDQGAIRTLSKSDTLVVACRSCTAALPEAKILRNGDSGTFVGIRVEAIPSYNLEHVGSSGRLQHAPGDGNSYLLTFGDKRIVIGGDGGVVPELNALRDIDVAFLPMNLPPLRTATIMVDTVRAMKPRVVYPHHYGEIGPYEAVRLLQDEPGLEVRIRDMR
jgi:L-ascorbate metabolism protein UlaG (beta-lactamase superfamily)